MPCVTVRRQGYGKKTCLLFYQPNTFAELLTLTNPRSIKMSLANEAIPNKKFFLLLTLCYKSEPFVQYAFLAL